MICLSCNFTLPAIETNTQSQEENNLEVQKRNKQSKRQPAKRLHNGIIDTNDEIRPTCKRQFKKQGIKKDITQMHNTHQKTDKQITQNNN